MTNDKANTIIGVFETMQELKENGEITHLEFKFDEENNTVDINVVPRQTLKYIECNFTITPEGAKFEES